MACKSCGKKLKKHNPSKVLTGLKNNKGQKFISSKKGKFIVFFCLIVGWPIIAIFLPLLFYWAVFGLPSFNKNKKNEKHKDKNPTKQSRPIYKLEA